MTYTTAALFESGCMSVTAGSPAAMNRAVYRTCLRLCETLTWGCRSDHDDAPDQIEIMEHHAEALADEVWERACDYLDARPVVVTQTVTDSTGSRTVRELTYPAHGSDASTLRYASPVEVSTALAEVWDAAVVAHFAAMTEAQAVECHSCLYLPMSDPSGIYS